MESLIIQLLHALQMAKLWLKMMLGVLLIKSQPSSISAFVVNSLDKKTTFNITPILEYCGKAGITDTAAIKNLISEQFKIAPVLQNIIIYRYGASAETVTKFVFPPESRFYFKNGNKKEMYFGNFPIVSVIKNKGIE